MLIFPLLPFTHTDCNSPSVMGDANTLGRTARGNVAAKSGPKADCSVNAGML